MVSKTCYKCGIEKPLKEFCIDNSRCDGYSYRCKVCANLSRSSYYIKNKDVLCKKALNYYHEKAKDTEYRNMLNEKGIQRYNKNSFDPSIAKLRRIHKSALSRCEDKYTDIDLEWLREQYVKARFCPECGVQMDSDGDKDTGKTLDHLIPLSIGGKHIQFNVRVICRKCNLTRPRGGSDIRAGKILVVWSETVTI